MLFLWKKPNGGASSHRSTTVGSESAPTSDDQRRRFAPPTLLPMSLRRPSLLRQLVIPLGFWAAVCGGALLLIGVINTISFKSRRYYYGHGILAGILVAIAGLLAFVGAVKRKVWLQLAHVVLTVLIVLCLYPVCIALWGAEMKADNAARYDAPSFCISVECDADAVAEEDPFWNGTCFGGTANETEQEIRVRFNLKSSWEEWRQSRHTALVQRSNITLGKVYSNYPTTASHGVGDLLDLVDDDDDTDWEGNKLLPIGTSPVPCESPCWRHSCGRNAAAYGASMFSLIVMTIAVVLLILSTVFALWNYIGCCCSRDDTVAPATTPPENVLQSKVPESFTYPPGNVTLVAGSGVHEAQTALPPVEATAASTQAYFGPTVTNEKPNSDDIGAENFFG